METWRDLGKHKHLQLKESQKSNSWFSAFLFPRTFPGSFPWPKSTFFPSNTHQKITSLTGSHGNYRQADEQRTVSNYESSRNINKDDNIHFQLLVNSSSNNCNLHSLKNIGDDAHSAHYFAIRLKIHHEIHICSTRNLNMYLV